MTDRLVIKTGEYNNNSGETKGEYVRLGVLMQGENGPYILLEPTVDLAGCLTKQNIMNHKNGRPVRGNLMVSIFSDDGHQKQSSGSGGSAGAQDFDDDFPYAPFMKGMAV